jgi:hypothetical protein
MAAETTILPAHLDLIVDRFHDLQCVPFLGAGANVTNSTRGYQGLRLGSEVADELVQGIQFEGRDPKDLPRVALQYEFIRDRPDLIKNLKAILPDEKTDPSPLLQTLVKLPFKLIVSTNYDCLLERALEATGRPFESIIQPLNGFDSTPENAKWFETLEVYEHAKLYKIHGTFKTTAPTDPPLIITEDDYIQFLTVVGIDNVGIPKLVTKGLVPNTLLFLGYGLEDWDFRTIYKGLIEPLPKHQSRKSFAIQKDPSDFWVEFWKAKGVIIYNIDLYDFADQLERTYFAKYPGTPI